MRTTIIGDIHGDSFALSRLLEELKPNVQEDKLILLGDLFDRGPDSWGVFQIVRELAEAFGDRFVLLRGNHEDYLLTEDPSWELFSLWNRVGRGATFNSFADNNAEMKDAADWIRKRAVLFYRGDGFQCVHAGLKVDPIEANDARTMVHDHYVVERNRYDGPLTIVGHIALEMATWFCGDGNSYQWIIDGRWYDLPEKGIICIDTGCGKGGRLTGMVIEDSKYILQSVSSDEYEW